MTLTQLFTAIANAIRAVTGKTGTIVAEDFPDEIADINTGNLSDEEYEEANDDLDDILENTTAPSGTLSITENGNYDVTNYANANVNVVSEYNIKSDKNAPYTAGSALGIRSIITKIKNLDALNYSSLSYLCYMCRNLKEITLINTNNVTNLANGFYYCDKLEEINLFDTSNVTNWQGAFSYCDMLSANSLNNIMQMCINSTSYTGTKKLSYLGLTSTQATTCQGLSNYQAFLSAGWTTGY